MSFNAATATRNKSDMNIVPLIDVMLVLLIIFMVTAPRLSQNIPLDLPQAGPEPPPPALVDPVRLRVDASGALFWNSVPLASTALDAALQVEAQGRSVEQQPVLEIEASPDSRYQVLTNVLASAHNARIAKITFVESASRY